ncbi:hypothetical protein AVEN_169495-1 [Araneus ventricosus]|uniref:Uncharacterized protein n=1 Tax=Araneus ventricosus TaxID=182803 RepID=A0A4Y2P028_ARAVE|nr:hypothetical protein AVEN_240399-1 [Araneus ventricosus]GBN44694.1 hypothetical protein AVEN_28058-1 [Araneus ventricosus]GBN79972.1 hypothetical protein AVEN_25181-1 [Araneus ventricosus]GBN80000.1 hypothetical protein AVEN_169495-1 [Araneus ventricosus]
MPKQTSTSKTHFIILISIAFLRIQIPLRKRQSPSYPQDQPAQSNPASPDTCSNSSEGAEPSPLTRFTAPSCEQIASKTAKRIECLPSLLH